MSSNDWQISTAGGTVTGTEEYVRATGAMLDALEPPIPFRITPPLESDAPQPTKEQAAKTVKEAMEAASREGAAFRQAWAVDHGANPYTWDDDAKRVIEAYRSVRDLGRMVTTRMSADRVRGSAARITTLLAAARALRDALTA